MGLSSHGFEGMVSAFGASCEVAATVPRGGAGVSDPECGGSKRPEEKPGEVGTCGEVEEGEGGWLMWSLSVAVSSRYPAKREVSVPVPGCGDAPHCGGEVA
eukprot:CAMPEP_0173438804 /NCGR_PEP_ID=MMETSP1357-20121228/20612_1 /TAXON_ID=77926 /ORGANISM="Hemiselmis rufescens, Strain PCC563" /LENGTH=100 /DNA_ID=CAMNT_0014404125 /DNA_START=759 /DNA_END=1058 /DNA_ORIENTATION=+